MRKSLTFNHMRKSWLYLLEGRQKSPFAPIRNNLINVTGMPGAYVGSKEIGVLYISQPVGFIVKDDEHALELKDELADWLITERAVPLQFDDEPGRTYFAEIEGTIEDFSRFVDQRKGVITFLCADPFSYGQELTQEFTQDSAIVENPGTAPADPIFELEVIEPTTFAMVQNGEDEYMAIGRPYEENEVPTSDRETILNDDASSLVGWSHLTGGSTLYNLGLVGGQMATNGYAFYPESYGSNPNGWVGPAIKRSLTEQLQDFEVIIDIAMLNRLGGVGQIRLLGLDANDKIVFSMGMMDSTSSKANNRAIYGLGENNATWFAYQGDNNQVVWNDARLWLRLRRRGNEFEAWIAEKLDPQGIRLTGRHTRTLTDHEGKYQAKLAQVVIYMAGARNFAHFPMYFHHLTVTKLINLADYEVPYIARVGDIITFDHTNEGDILINGEPRNDLKDFGGSFFTLNKGFNQLTVFPFETFNTKLRFRPRYR